MARRRYYRSRRTVPRQKWLINMCDVRIDVPTAQDVELGTETSYIFSTPIIINESNQVLSSTMASAPQPTATNATILKTGRWKVKGVISTGLQTTLDYMVGLCYVPEGYTLSNNGSMTNTLPYKHPEWVLAWKRFDFINLGQSNEISLSSRLKRNLNSGDRIVLFVIAYSARGATTIPGSSPVLRATVTYVCRSN